MRHGCVLVFAVLLSSGFLAAQPLQLNTTVYSFTPVSGNPWVADIKGWTDAQGRDFALVCRGNDGLGIYEITNPATPVFAANVPATGSDLKDIDVVGNYAYAVQQSGSTLVIDIANPYAPVVVTSIAGGAHTGFYYESAQLYTQGRNGASPYDARIYNVANPAAPVFLGSYPSPGSEQTHDTYCQDGLMYVSTLFGATAGTDIVDISNPAAPVFLHQINSTAFNGDYSHSSWIYNPPGNRKYCLTCNETAGGHLKLFDVTDPNNTPLSGEYQSATGGSISIHNVQVVDRYGFISYYADYLRIVDLSNPHTPVEVGTYDPFPSNVGQSTFDGSWAVHCFKVLPNGNYRIVMAESFNLPLGFWVIDFAPPSRLDLALSTTGAGDLFLQVTRADAFAEIWNPFSVNTTQVIGTGPLAGLQGDALYTLLYPPGTPLFHTNCDATGTYTFTLPPGSLPGGFSVDLRSLSFVGGAYKVTELARIGF